MSSIEKPIRAVEPLRLADDPTTDPRWIELIQRYNRDKQALFEAKNTAHAANRTKFVCMKNIADTKFRLMLLAKELGIVLSLEDGEDL